MSGAVKHSPTAKAVAAGAVVVAVYEAAAVIANVGPTITHLVEQLPELVELALILGVSGWLLHHFGWFTRWPRRR